MAKRRKKRRKKILVAYTSLECPYCGSCGRIVFLATSDPARVVVICNECGDIWIDPNDIRMGNSIDTLPQDRTIGPDGVKVLSWATKEVVERAGLGHLVYEEIPQFE